VSDTFAEVVLDLGEDASLEAPPPGGFSLQIVKLVFY
jgi:hypothetical protein